MALRNSAPSADTTMPRQYWKITGGGRIGGTVEVPGDKSISHRGLLFSAISDGTSHITGISRGEDCTSTADALKLLGVSIVDSGGVMIVEGRGLHGLKSDGHVELDCGNSGTTMRLLLGILAGQPRVNATLVGDVSLTRRPMKRVVEPLETMGARLRTLGPQHRPPVEIRGGALRGVSHRTDVASAQVKSALLLAGLLAEGHTEVCEPARSRDHTERMLLSRGVSLKMHGYCVQVQGGQRIQPQNITIPGDLSAAAFFWVLGAVLSDGGVYVDHVGVNETRTGILEVLRSAGVVVDVSNVVTEGGEIAATVGVARASLSAFTVSGDLVPRLVDEIPVLAVLASQADGETVIADAMELRVKESDRIVAIAEMLQRMGGQVTETSDGLRISGPCDLVGAEIDSHGDHRIAMAGAVAGLMARGSTLIRDVACVNTSFPGFLQRLRALAPDAVIEELEEDAPCH